MATDIVRGTVIGDVSALFRVKGTFRICRGTEVLVEKPAEARYWRSCGMSGREIVDSILSDEWKPSTDDRGITCEYTIASLDEVVG